MQANLSSDRQQRIAWEAARIAEADASIAAGRFVEAEHRIANPRHIVVYLVAPDGVVEILGLAHDRMLLGRAARRMRREADA